ncbi:TlyA family RNA methyltransferase [Clostridium sp. D2Q-14]|uniref:TlyA family RNA methyltransferase n=1 Tax=Anaeromonas gelatinilytica TaxID=2683194 RepID=UPI00193C46A3|nr:TlyA family RNA methyltransferase [Anaeromonas gelatinilytica]MBS4536216.1 TlyA family RNA methyltransferase [Anaeromonas gelatinilytica]
MDYIRVDVLMNSKGLVESRELAKKAIKKGLVKYNGKIITKPSFKVTKDAKIELLRPPLDYVGRGGYKLEKAIKAFNLDLSDKIAMDIGASTGGFTDCMIQHEVRKVYAIDVGYNQLCDKLKNDDRVINMEKTNIRYLDIRDIEELQDFISIDVSFISLTKVLLIAKNFLKKDGEIIALIKPQFEVGKKNIGKRGIVKKASIHFDVIKKIKNFIKSLDLVLTDIEYSPIKGGGGNIEYLAYITNNISHIDIDKKIQKILLDSHEKL